VVGADLSAACGCRALSNGMENPTLHPWRPAVVDGRTPFVVTDPSTKQIENLQCGATRPWSRERCVQSSLLCVGMANRRADAREPRPGQQCYFLETMAAKEAKRRFDCSGNHLGCPIFAWGIGGIAVRTKWQSGTMARQHHGIAPKGKPPDRRREVCCGEIQPDLSRKINSRSCPVQSFFQ
jgi:hypothetical protein